MRESHAHNFNLRHGQVRADGTWGVGPSPSISFVNDAGFASSVRDGSEVLPHRKRPRQLRNAVTIPIATSPASAAGIKPLGSRANSRSPPPDATPVRRATAYLRLPP